MDGGFHKWGYPTWLVYNWKSRLEMDDLGVPLFQETTITPITMATMRLITMVNGC